MSEEEDWQEHPDVLSVEELAEMLAEVEGVEPEEIESAVENLKEENNE